MMRKILVTDAGYKHTLAAIRYLAQSGFEVDAIGMSKDLSRWSHFLAHIAYPQSEFCEPEIGKFLDFLSSRSYSVLLPIGAKSVRLVASFKAEIEEYCSVPIVSLDKVEMCLDKSATASFAGNRGIKVPRTWAFKSLDMLKERINELDFPVVVKGKHEIWKDKPLYAHNVDQLLESVAQWGKTSDEVSFPLIQQYIDGIGCGFFALYQRGVCKRVFMHRRIRETPPSGGASCCAMSIYEPDLMAAGKRLLDALEWHGVAMVEFKRERNTGHLYLMEINPKFWGSLDLALASGVNFPVLDVRMALGEDISYSEDYQVGLKFHWPLDGEIRHVVKKPSAVFPVFWDFLNPRVQSNLWLRDPVPALFSLYRESKYLASGLLQKIGLRKLLYRIRDQGLHTALARTFSEATGVPIMRFSRITPEIYVGSQHSKLGKWRLRQFRVNGIVNMRSEFDDAIQGLALEHYCHLPTIEFDAPSVKQLSQGIAFINQVVNEGGKVYIHCKEGVSRAPMMAVAYFVSQDMTIDEAVSLVKESRSFINILPVQMKQLRRFEENLGRE
jgi:predicted ATP-grasp superfamily ATP-dependent carboligase